MDFDKFKLKRNQRRLNGGDGLQGVLNRSYPTRIVGLLNYVTKHSTFNFTLAQPGP